MAYAAVASLLQTIDILVTHHHHSISPEFENQIKSIHQHTCSLRSFIEASSARVYNWEETIREVTVRAEDIIELLLSDSLLESSVGSSQSEFEKGKYEVSYGFDELENVTEEIKSIVHRLKGRRRTETANGSGEELMEIISLLTGGSSSLERIAICGSGGMGKKTLTQNAYFHPLIKEHFDVRAGSTITREYALVNMIGDFLRCMNVKFTYSNSVDELIERFLHNLGRRRYLVVLDDMWSFKVLERLNLILPDYGNGSRILLNTRSLDLAKTAHHIHEMLPLDEDTSWNLLREKIYGGDPCPFQLESVGKTIARSCGGHPLSIAVVSGVLLASDQTEATWEDVSENIKIASQEDGDKLSEVLYLGYIYLPRHLRPCFLYLGIFPKGQPIYLSTLVKMWVAEGFLNESGYKSLEETGEEYVKDLVRRCLVYVSKRKSNGRIKSIRVHDLVGGMCLRQAHRDNFNFDFDRICSHTPKSEVKEIIKSCRRASNFKCYVCGVYGSTIRTLFFYSKYGKLDLRCWMRNVRLLRILSLVDVNNYSLCSNVLFKLSHLRYFAFHCSRSIPKAISNLENLQTLIIRHDKKEGTFDKLPGGIWRMQQLRYLYVISFKFPDRKGPTFALENLHTLSQVVDFVCSREILKMFPNMRKLALLYTDNLKDVVGDYELHNLIYLQKLEILKLQTNLSFREEYKMGCAFPPTLKKLSLHGLRLSWEDMKIIASLPNLNVLKLRNHACVGTTWETSEGGFTRLILLLIEKSNLEKWITNSSHFPRLRRLVLVHCSSLLDVPYEMAEIPPLQLIELDDANHSLLRSAERIQQDRRSLGHYPLQIRECKGKN